MHFPDSNVLRSLKSNFIKTIVCISALLSPMFSKAQTAETSTRLLEKIASYNNRKPLEKVHLHLNKNTYVLQDTIWFQSYLVDANNKPANTSKILYVDLINSKDSICKTMEVPLKNGVGGGNYLALDSLKPGIYHIRAYTNLLKKIGTAYFFNKEVPVSAGSASLAAKKSNGQPIELRFFPEGGALVSGLKSKVVVQLLNANDPAESYTANLVDNDKKEVLKFTIPASGISAFSFKPEKGKTYVAVLQAKGNDANVYYLPKALDKGYGLAVDNSRPDSLLIEMSATRDFPSGREVIFVPFSGNRALFSFHTKFVDTTLPLRFPKNTLTDGIVKLVVFDIKGKPLAHTQVFIDPKQLLSVKKEGLATKYKGGSETTASFTLADEEGKPIAGNFSVAVNKSAAYANALPSETYIVLNLLLSPERNNTIIAENSTGIAKMTPEQAAFFNDLILAADTEKLPWTEIMSGDFSALSTPVQDSIFISGIILRPNKEPKKYAVVTLAPSGNSDSGHTLKTTSDENGRFRLAIPDYFMKDKFAIRAKADNILYRVSVDSPEAYPILEDTLYTAKLNPVKAVEVPKPVVSAEKAVAETPKSVETAATAQSLKSNSKNLNGFGKADKVLTAADIKSCPSPECLSAFLPGVYGKNGNLYLVPDSGTKSKGAMRVLIDGEVATLSTIVPKNVETIEFLKSPEFLAAYGTKGKPGVLVVTTINVKPEKTDSVKSIPVAKAAPVAKVTTPLVKDAATLRFESSKKEGDFQLPFQLPTSSFEDGGVRSAVQFKPSGNAIFWNAKLTAGEDGKISVQYVNSTQPGTYSITIEGISNNGKICSKVFVYEVY